GVQNAGRVVQHVDESVSTMRVQAKRAQIGTRTLVAGLSTAWTTFTQPATNGDRPTGQSAKPTLSNPTPDQKAQPVVEPSSSVSPTPAPAPDSSPVPPSSMPSTETQQLAAQPQTATDAPGNSEIP
ncbi:MAG: hypothetical protein AAFO87_17655, partial [Cyanobacteria bacterium J06607_6]